MSSALARTGDVELARISEAAGGEVDRLALLAKVTEEIGEVADALLRYRGGTAALAAVEGEIADGLIALTVLAASLGVHVDSAVTTRATALDARWESRKASAHK